MEYGKAFSFFTEDENWISKVLIAGLLLFASGIIPILPMLVVLGYMLDVMKNVAKGEPRPLPVWDNFEDKLKNGASVFVIGFVYVLPLILTFGCAFIAVFGTIFATAANARGGGNSDAGPAGFIPALILCALCVSMLYGFCAGILTNAATIIYAHSGKLGDALKVREVWALAQRYLADFVMTALVLTVGGLVGALAMLVTCGLGWLIVAPWLNLTQYHLLGQIQRKAFPPPADTLAPA